MIRYVFTHICTYHSVVTQTTHICSYGDYYNKLGSEDHVCENLIGQPGRKVHELLDCVHLGSRFASTSEGFQMLKIVYVEKQSTHGTTDFSRQREKHL